MAENDFADPVIDGGGFGDDWQAAAAEQERRRRDEEMTARMNENRADLAQYDEMLGAQRAQAAQRRANGLRQTAIAMRYAMQNGGKVPEQLIPAFNQKMGYDGKTRRFLGGMYDGKGNLHFFMQNGDGQGNFQDAPVTLDRKGQFDLMREFPGIFSDEDVNAMAQSLMTKDGLTRDQIWGAGATPGSKTATGGTVVNPSWLGGPQRRSSISVFGANGRGGFTNYESSEQTGYQLQQRDSGTRAPAPELSERERIARMKEQGALDRAQMREEGIAERMANRDQTRRDIAEAANLLKKYGIDVSAQLKERGLDISQQSADARSSVRAGGARFDKDRYAALKERHDALALDADGNSRTDLSKEEKATVAALKKQMDAMLIGGETSDGGGEALTPQQKAAQMLQARQGTQQPAQSGAGQYGLRNDGKTYKGTGWLGELKLPNGGVASEYTIGVNFDGKEIDIPTLVPTLTKAQQDLMVNDIIPNNKPVPDDIVKAAVDFAKMRLANGQSVFANDGQPPAHDGAAPLQQTQGTQQTQGETKVPTADSVKKAAQESPGNITEDDEGMRSAEINNYEYLSDEDKKTIKPRYQESETEDFDEAAVNVAQKKANEAKAASDAARKKEEDRVRKALSGKGWTQKRIDRAVERHMKYWDAQHDAKTRSDNDRINEHQMRLRRMTLH